MNPGTKGRRLAVVNGWSGTVPSGPGDRVEQHAHLKHTGIAQHANPLVCFPSRVLCVLLTPLGYGLDLLQTVSHHASLASRGQEATRGLGLVGARLHPQCDAWVWALRPSLRALTGTCAVFCVAGYTPAERERLSGHVGLFRSKPRVGCSPTSASCQGSLKVKMM